MRKACQIGLVIFFVLLGLTLLWAWDMLRAQAELDYLYWIQNNTHSGFVDIVIPYAEERVQQRTTELTVFAAALAVFSVGGLLVCKYASKKHVSTAALLLLFLLFLTPLPATARLDVATLLRCYARVEIHVPPNPEVGDLMAVTGYIKPMPNTLHRYWVCYHIGVVFPYLDEWLGAGYVTEIGIGKVAYIEWKIDGVYHDILGADIPWYHPIFTKTEIINNLWTAHVWDDEGVPMLEEDVSIPLPLSGEYLLGIAGGESVETKNTMSAVFSNVTWTTYDGNYGFWDGSVFDCEVIEEAPYDVGIISPYYKFMVRGGDPDPPPNPPDDGDDDGGGGGFDMYPTPLDERQRPEQ